MFKSWKKYIVGCILLISACTVTADKDKDKEEGVSDDVFIINATGERTVAESAKGTVKELFLDAKTGNLKLRSDNSVIYYFIKSNNPIHAVYAPTEAKNTFLGIALSTVFGDKREALIVYKDNKTDFWSEESSVSFTVEHKIPNYQYDDFVVNAKGDRTLETIAVTVNAFTGDIHTRDDVDTILYSYLGRVSEKTAKYQVGTETKYVGIALTDTEAPTREFNGKLELYKEDGLTAWTDPDNIEFGKFHQVDGIPEFAKDWKEITPAWDADKGKGSFAIAKIGDTILLIGGDTMYKSVNRGRTWDYDATTTGLPTTIENGRAVVLPNSHADYSDRIVLVHNGDVYTSSDVGLTWITQTALPESTGTRRSPNLVYFNGTIYAISGNQSGATDGVVFQSINGGETFTKINLNGTIPGTSDGDAVVLDGKIYFMGGWNSDLFNNAVYSSVNGATWVNVNPDTETPWSKRERFVLLATEDKMYIMGGGTSNSATESDVWSSTDGITWIEETDEAWNNRRNFGGVWYKDAGTITVNGDTITTPDNEMIIFGGQDQSGSFHTFGE